MAGSNAETIVVLKQARLDLRAAHAAITSIDGGIASKVWLAIENVEDRLARELLRRELTDA